MTDSVPTTPNSPCNEQIEVRTKSTRDISKFKNQESSEPPTVKVPIHEESEDYNMEHPNRGTCLVFNHLEYDDKELNKREGTTADVNRIKETFERLGFLLDVCQDYEYNEIKEKIKQLSEQDHTDNDCVCIIVLTHGDNNNIINAKDLIYSLDELYKPFTANECITLAKKPKLFFFSACRGRQLDKGIDVSFERQTSRTEIDSIGKVKYSLPEEADFLFGFSTAPGYCSWRSETNGTWYIQSLCDILDKYAATTDLLNILTKTAQLVSMRISSNTGDKKKENKKQVPEFHSRLLHRLYLKPKQDTIINPNYNLIKENAESEQAISTPETVNASAVRLSLSVTPILKTHFNKFFLISSRNLMLPVTTYTIFFLFIILLASQL